MTKRPTLSNGLHMPLHPLSLTQRPAHWADTFRLSVALSTPSVWCPVMLCSDSGGSANVKDYMA